MKNLKFLGLLLIGILILSGCGKRAAEEVTKIPVSAVSVERGNLKETLFYVGDIAAKDKAIVYPKVTGKIVEELVKEGDLVKKGDILAYIDRDEVGFKFEKAPIESPINGIVGIVNIDKGVTVSPQTPIVTVVNMDVVKVKVNVIERELPRIKDGQAAEIKVDAYPGEVFEGFIDRISPVVDLTSRTSPVEMKISNFDHRLKPGMFARIKILIREKENALLIPRDAIVKENSSRYVFIVSEDNKVRHQKIEVGLCENNIFEVINGLNEGDIVVTMGNTRLEDGDMVEIVDSPQSTVDR